MFFVAGRSEAAAAHGVQRNFEMIYFHFQLVTGMFTIYG